MKYVPMINLMLSEWKYVLTKETLTTTNTTYDSVDECTPLNHRQNNKRRLWKEEEEENKISRGCVKYTVYCMLVLFCSILGKRMMEYCVVSTLLLLWL